MIKRVFITVGSTKFPDLVKAILSTESIGILEALGVSELSIQYGTDKQLYYFQMQQLATTISITGFDYSPSIDKEMMSADLIISHAGSGSVLEALHLGKFLIIVPNASLMDNHQAEVAKALADSGYLIQSSPATLAMELLRLRDQGLHSKVIQSFPTHGNRKFAQILDEEMGFTK